MTKQKKPKVGDTVGWAIVDRDGDIYYKSFSRKDAREVASMANQEGYYKPYRIAKIVLSK